MSEASKIYIDMDSILDTRQGILISMLGQEDALKMVSSHEYNFRDVDDFTVDMSAYKAKGDAGDPEVLKHSTVTYMEVVLKSKIANISKRNAFNNTHSTPEVILNTYPYRLTERQVKTVRDAVFVRLGECCDVTLVYDHPSVWTPGFIKASGVYAFYAYSFGKWMQEHCAKLETTELRDVQMYFACVGDERVPEKDLKDIVKLGFKDIFTYTEYLLSGVTKLTLLPVVFFTNVIIATAILKKQDQSSVVQSMG